MVSQSNIKLFERERFEDVLCAKFRSGYEETYNLGELNLINYLFLLIIIFKSMSAKYECHLSRAGAPLIPER